MNSAEQLLSIFSNDNELLSCTFSKVKIAYSTNKFTLLPEKSENPKVIFDYLKIDTEENNICNYNISETQILYFCINNSIKHFFENRYRNVEWYFGDLGIFNYSNSKLSFKNHVLCNLYGNDLSIAHKENGKVKYYNKFFVENKEDLLYYLKLTYEQLGLDTNQFACYLYGLIEEKSPMYTFSFAYIRNYEIDRTLKHDLDYHFTYPDYNLHYFYNLLALGK